MLPVNRSVAESQGRKRSDVVRESISIYLWESRFEGARKSLGARAKKKGKVTDEDILNEEASWRTTKTKWTK
jgi:hypothetical protein